MQKRTHMSLKLDHERFVEEYINNGNNALEAYKTINPTVTHGSAGELGSRMLKRPEVKEAIEKRRNEIAAIGLATRMEIAKELLDLARDQATGRMVRKHYYDAYNRVMGFYTDKHEIKHVDVQEALESADPNALLKLLEEE